MKSKRIAHRIYQVFVSGVEYQVDGQNHEGSSNEWELFEVDGNNFEWCFTVDTKREAMEYLKELSES